MRRAALAALGILTGLVPAFAPVWAHAATCPQEKAIYRDRDNAYELAFSPVKSDAEANTHRFSLKVLGTALSLDGYVMGSTPVNRSNGVLFFHCPEGDVTGKDIADCTIWTGVVYDQSAGRIDLLPAQGKAAADQVLLPDLGPAIQQSKVWGEGRARVAPWDVLDFKECAK
jgi:hypothetical protein